METNQSAAPSTTVQKPFKTYTDKRIELGQDINNTWAIIAAAVHRPGERAPISMLFDTFYPIVQKKSREAREEADKENAR